MHKSPEGLAPSLVTAYETWEEASRKARLLALMEGVHAWGRREDHHAYVELVMAYHQFAPWAEPWHVFDVDTFERERPSGSGLYLLGNGRPMFAGDTDDLQARLSFHLSDPGTCLEDVRPLLFSFQLAAARDERHVLLTRLIRAWHPRCNSVA